jgi:TonB family protein
MALISRIVVIFIVVLFLWMGRAFTGENPQTEADKLLDRARQLSDIRKPGARSFHLSANFSFIGEDLETREGTFTELWASDSQWRREISVGSIRSIEIGAPNRLYRFDGNQSFPEQAARVPAALLMFPAALSTIGFESVNDVAPNDSSTRCAVTKPMGARRVKHGFCFDQKNGLLIEKIAPEFFRARVADYSCGYDKFMKFGEQWFPQEIECLLNGHRQLQIHVMELVPEAFTDASLFSPPLGAVEIGRCMAGATPPKAESTPDPMFPAGERGHTSTVRVRMVVDVKGKPQNVEVTRSGGKAFDKMAVEAVQKWRFKPAMCNGEAMPMQIEADVSFRSY